MYVHSRLSGSVHAHVIGVAATTHKCMRMRTEGHVYMRLRSDDRIHTVDEHSCPERVPGRPCLSV